MPESDDHYAELELSPGASRRRVKDAFREMAKVYHPDLYPYDGDYRLRCEEKMLRINAAYQYLRTFAPDEDEGRAKAERRGSWGYDPQDPAGDRAQPGEKKKKNAERTASRPPEERPQAPPFRREEYTVTPQEPGLKPWTGETQDSSSSWNPLKRAPLDHPDFMGLWQTGGAFLVTIFTLAALFFIRHPAPAVYFEILRVVAFIGWGYGTYFSIARGSWEIGMALILMTLAVNPIIPVPMSHGEWMIFNFVTPSALIYFWIVLFERESRKAHRRAIDPRRD